LSAPLRRTLQRLLRGFETLVARAFDMFPAALLPKNGGGRVHNDNVGYPFWRIFGHGLEGLAVRIVDGRVVVAVEKALAKR
jgi:hypothetical protein